MSYAITQNGDAGVNIALRDGNGLALLCYGTVATSVLDEANAYQKGCLYFDTDVATGTGGVYANKGTSAAPVWSLVTQA